ncbi:MAG: DUF192 domain-containing protein [Ardenticatenaceae bacterium]|nr:DUF192 domain-containing protein [Ardenticatenaceae bacterium]MCB8973890.1 DUF192 domain-containing protein [Ardenticatenaceae bacterium]
MGTRQIIHVESGEILIPQAKWCDGFGSKLRGFTFRRTLGPQDGLVLVEARDNRVNTAIHMLFVFFDLGVIWVNDAGEVVGTVVAQPWRLSYLPPAPARYVIEGQPEIVNRVQVGDHIQFVNPPGAKAPG